MSFLDNPTPILFFTGKGGVGKTSSSCATAVALAKRGKKVLIVSTDPASNIHEVFGCDIKTVPSPIPGVDGLFGLNVDPVQAAEAYREKVIGPYRGVLPEAAITSMEEQLAGACTVEIAAFDEFAKLLANQDVTSGFDHVVFDTAPTGHTLRLLSLPTAWTGFIDGTAAGTSFMGPLQGLADQRDLYAGAVDALADAGQTTLVLVSRPDAAALDEAARTSLELAEIGIKSQQLLVNGVFKAANQNDAVALDLERFGQSAMEKVPDTLASFPRTTVPLKARQLIGLDALATFFDMDASEGDGQDTSQVPDLPAFDSLVDDMEASGRGVVMTMGKGGVGKTTMAIDLAMALAERGHEVLLTTTDPTGHVARAVVDAPQTLKVERIDPEEEVAKYRDEVMRTTGVNLDDDARALLAEDLASPCTEEIAVFQAFAATVDKAQDKFVVLDTAPTGHTILLLDAAQSFHAEVNRQAQAVPEAVMQLLERLRDPSFTRILLCTVPEATPVHEAAELQNDLRRAEIEPYAWIVNQSLTPLDVSDPVLQARRHQEARYIREVVDQHAARSALVPWRLSKADQTAGEANATAA